MTRAVHQLLPTLAPADAVGSAVLRTRSILRRAGFRSEIYAGEAHRELAGEAHPAGALCRHLRESDGVIYHLSIGSDVAGAFETARARRVIVYHNITPARFLEAISAPLAHLVDRGRDDLHRLGRIADLGIAYSSFTLGELSAAGVADCVVVPPPIDLARLHPRPATPSTPPRILFVGRLVPNKRHDDLIRALAVLRSTSLPDARLVLAGSAGESAAYLEALRRLTVRLDVDRAVDMPGRRLDDGALAELYASASVFACASEHEGFCFPLVEAMAFSVPILAYAAAAVPETVGKAGVLIGHKDPLVWAALLHRLITDRTLRAWSAREARRRLADLDEAVVSRQLLAALARAGLTPGR